MAVTSESYFCLQFVQICKKKLPICFQCLFYRAEITDEQIRAAK
jgi:hypothetical protein